MQHWITLLSIKMMERNLNEINRELEFCVDFKQA